MVTHEGSSSRAVWKTHSSSSAKRSVVAHATTSTDIEVGEEFEETWKVECFFLQALKKEEDILID